MADVRILVTGGTGFFGKSILDYFSRNRHSCDFTFLSRRGFSREFLRDIATPKQILGDIRTFDVGSERFDCVIHAATPVCLGVPDDEMQSVILDGTANAIKQAKRCGATKFMMISTGGIYGRGLGRSNSEGEDPCPFTVYGRSKLQAERMAVESGLHALIPRCFAFVGRHLDGNAHFAIGNFIRDALAGKDIVINGDGSPMRSYMYADDLVEWLFAILERGESGRVYNVGSDQSISIRNLATLVRDVLQSKSPIRVLGRAVPGAADCYVPDISRAREELGLEVKTGLGEAIRLSVRGGTLSGGISE